MAHDTTDDGMRASRRAFLKATGVATAAAATGAGVGTAAAQPDVDSLIDDLTLAQKAAQMTQVAISSFEAEPAESNVPDSFGVDTVGEYFSELGIGSILSGGAEPPSFDANEVVQGINALQEYNLKNADHGIPFLYGVDATHGNGLLEGVANAVRLGLDGAPSLVATDQQRGFVSPSTMLSWDHDETNAITFTQEAVAAVLVGSYLGNYWPIGEEVLVSRPPSLPARYDMFRPVVFTTTLTLRAGESVVADLYARPTGSDDEFEVLTGDVVDVRQNLLDPSSSDFGFENSLVIDTGQERITVGGYGAFLEDYEVKHTTLRRA